MHTVQSKLRQKKSRVIHALVWAGLGAVSYTLACKQKGYRMMTPESYDPETEKFYLRGVFGHTFVSPSSERG